MPVCPVCESALRLPFITCDTCGFQAMGSLEGLGQVEQDMYELSVKNAKAWWRQIDQLNKQVAVLQRAAEAAQNGKTRWGHKRDSVFAYLVKPVKFLFKQRIDPPVTRLRELPAIKIKVGQRLFLPNWDFSRNRIWVKTDIVEILGKQNQLMRNLLEEQKSAIRTELEEKILNKK